MFSSDYSWIPRWSATCAGLAMFVTILFVNSYAAEERQSDSLNRLSELLQLAGYVLVIIVGAAGTFYGVFNRKKYDGLKSIIEEKDLVIETIQERFNAIEIKCREQREADANRLELERHKVINLTVSNEGVVSLNLQQKAVLKALRLAGKWDGHEDELFK